MSSAARVLAGTVALVATLAATSLVPAHAHTADDGVVTARGGLTVREAPSVKSPSSATLAKGSRIPIVCRTDGSIVGGSTTWYLLPPTTEEWISGAYVRVDGDVPECGSNRPWTRGRTTTGLTIRRGPHSADQSLGTANKGQVLQLQCKINSQQISGNSLWYKLHGSQGWVSGRYVTNVGAAPGFC